MSEMYPNKWNLDSLFYKRRSQIDGFQYLRKRLICFIR